MPEPGNDPIGEPSGMARLKDDLRALYGSRAEVPFAIDQALRGEIRGHFQRRTLKRSSPWRAVPWLAAAAAIALAVWLFAPIPMRSVPPANSAQAQPADLDRNGRIDILDAFALARRIESGEAIDVAADVNHDGQVDRGDVDAIARQAVSLGTGVQG